MRLIIYTGKGGVGKTSTSAATAYRLSELGYRTLLMSTDSAHSLGDSLDMDIGVDIKTVKENLDVLEIDIIHEMRNRWSDIQEYVCAFMLSQGMGEISAEEMAILPGMEMISALFYVNQFNREGTYDVIVMDTAPTGETLRLMSFPDITNWYIDRAFSVLKKMIGIARMTVGKVMDMPLPSKEVMESVEDIKRNMEDVKAILEDPSKTTVRLVLNPERMVIKETMRAYTYLSLYNK
ncbi:ArsA family ATPase, partial [Candidatus Methanarcanum hacksteinii]|uniref:ArsA family ATPase n=1 Tax=Candidatus Methanarcanum hacksteinii TaxID=2911857 RepID=UPI0037DCDD93